MATVRSAARTPPAAARCVRAGPLGVAWTRTSRAAAPSLCLLAALATAACGGGPQLSNLRCRETPCQDPEKPFTVRLAVDFSDPTGTLGAGALELLVDGNVQSAVSLADLFAAQHLDAKATAGTLAVDEDVTLGQVVQDQTFNAGLQARNGLGQSSNQPSLTFKLTLGGP
jgi:hypothetical protein